MTLLDFFEKAGRPEAVPYMAPCVNIYELVGFWEILKNLTSCK